MIPALALGWLGKNWIQERVQKTDSAEGMTHFAPLDVYLLDLARQRGIAPQQIAARSQIPDILQLFRHHCSCQINELTFVMEEESQILVFSFSEVFYCVKEEDKWKTIQTTRWDVSVKFSISF